MTRLRNIGLLLALPFALLTALAEEEADTPKPVDRPMKYSPQEMEKRFEPYIKLARETFPEARKRFLEGLPEGYKFYVTYVLHDHKDKKLEQVFIRVGSIKNGMIYGTIDSDLRTVTSYKTGAPIEVKEQAIRDWTIVAPDGSEEGNYLGKFLDIYHDGVVPLILEIKIAKDGHVQAAKFLQAINRYKQDVSYCIPDSIKAEAVKTAESLTYDPIPEEETQYTYVIYNVRKNEIEPLESKEGSRQ